MKRIRFLALFLLLTIGLGAATASAAQTSGLTISVGTAIYSISNETLIRMVDEPASQAECGEDEYVTVRAVIKNTSGEQVSMHDVCFRIDGGEKLIWKDFTLEAGEKAYCHVYHTNARYLTPGLHTVVLYMSGTPLYTGRFSIGRDWSKVMTLPTEEQIAARPADERSPYMFTWLTMGRNVRYDAYCVDFKSDHIPSGTYSSLFNGYMDYSSLKKQYVSVTTDCSISLYGGLQMGDKGEIGEAGNSILSMWDLYCTDKHGNVTVIHPTRTYMADQNEIDDFTGVEGNGSQTLNPYEWKAGRWYRMLLLCGTSEDTGNTTVEQWFQDLTTNEWTHICTYDTGVKNSCFIGDACIFSENYLKQYAGSVRSLEFTNVRIHTRKGWQDVERTKSGVDLKTDGSHTNAYGSWEAGVDAHSFYMITTGVSGWGRTKSTGALSITNLDSGEPF